MGKIIANIVRLFNRRLWLYAIVLIGLLGGLFLGIQRLELNEDIYAIFPENDRFQQFNETLKERNINSRIVFTVNAQDKDVYQLEEEMELVAEQLSNQLGDDIAELKVFRADVQNEVIDQFYSNYPALLGKADYARIDSLLQPDSIKVGMQRVADRLSGTQGFFLKDVLKKDPLGIGWDALSALNPSSDSAAVQLEDGILFTKDKKEALFTARLNFDINESARSTHFNETLIALKEQLNKKQPEIGFDYFGTFQIAYGNSVQVKKDTTNTVLIGVGLIILVILVYFRSILMPILFVMPALFSAVCGLGLVGFIQPDISMISLATSAVLLGIVLDYSFHFFTHYGESGDLEETVKSISVPMLVGSFTTVAAFAALMFTDSVILQDFGIIALCILFSAAIFTVLLLPTLLKVIGFKGGKLKQVQKRDKKLPKMLMRFTVFAIVFGTAYSLVRMGEVGFDSNLSNLSFHEEDLKDKEAYLTGINPNEQKKIYVFSEASTMDDALRMNFDLFQALKPEKEKGRIKELVSVAPYVLPESSVKDGYKDWNLFWSEHGEAVKTAMIEEGQIYDFSARAFEPFFEWTEQTKVHKPSSVLFDELGLSDLMYQKENTWVTITTCVADVEDLELVKNKARTVDGVFVFDRGELANALITTVKDDFNYLLLFSSLIVFITLLLIYGRIELALFSFFPMVISWVWILGFAATFGVEFNFVNIIIATFIFGLGDDFSIFVTDGLLKKYRTGENTLKSYKSAILLSGITTVIGTGVLIFAKHPAIHSIAAISVLGIACIILITLVVQPAIFNFFVLRRTRKKLSPVTFGILLYSVFLFAYFLVGCIVLNILLLLMFLVPVNRLKKRNFLNFLISKMAKSTLYMGAQVKKRVIGKEHLDYDNPSVIIANHSSFLDILCVLMLHPKTIIMVKKWVYNSPFFGPFIRYSGYLFMEEGPNANLDTVKQRVKEGYSIVIFPEGTRSKDGKIARFKKGAFFLAKELGLDIQPLLILGANEVNAKNDMLIKQGTILISVMERVKATDPLFEKRMGIVSKTFSDRMKAEQWRLSQTYANSKWLTSRLMYNYIFKGPITEWYVRTKWKMERQNFEFYDKLIGERKRIYDIGCGYGYLSFYLHYRDDRRMIQAADYDEGKIALAKNCADKTEQLQFAHGDARELTFEKPDVIMYTDVLHYLLPEDQEMVMSRAADSLNDGGVLLIRDGVTDLGDRHAFTKKTERFSTKYIGFNKTSNELSFFSVETIRKFAERKSLSFKMIEQSKKTSNVLFVLEKRGNEHGEGI